jgi:putative membrane protein
VKKTIILLIVLSGLALTVFAQNQRPDDGYYYHMMGPWTWGWMLVGSIFFLLVVGVIIWFIVAALGRTRQPGVPEKPMEILKKRYARGEITKEEYERIKKDLEE